jgi:hypothetical protein
VFILGVLIYLILIGISIYITYLIIKVAVKHAIIESLKDIQTSISDGVKIGLREYEWEKENK